MVILAGISAQRAMSFPEDDLPEALAWAVANSKELEAFLDESIFPEKDEKLLGEIKNPTIMYSPKLDNPAIIYSPKSERYRALQELRAFRELGKRSGGSTVVRIGSITVDRPTAAEIRCSFEKSQTKIDILYDFRLTESEYKMIERTYEGLNIVIPVELKTTLPRSSSFNHTISSKKVVLRQNPFAWWPGQPQWLVSLSMIFPPKSGHPN
ncbi:hypothetical protein LBMAG53_24590 [Planctomycetota bacterium]|nr:hypothetical protein LBMAG53_24590 [Planctomycetota bacterium]